MASLDQCRVPAKGEKNMNRHAVLITNSKMELVEDNSDGDILAFARKLIGCDVVELVGLSSHKGLLVDEEGWLKPNYLNLVASIMAGLPIGGHAVLVGLGPSEIGYLSEEFSKRFVDAGKGLFEFEH